MTRQPASLKALAHEIAQSAVEQQLIAMITPVLQDALRKAAVIDLRARLKDARKHTPGGQLTRDEIAGVVKSTARKNHTTPEALIRWQLEDTEETP